LLFGDPTRIVSGAFWGFAVTQGNPPYLASLSFGVVPFALALAFVLSARRNEGRFWIGVAAAALVASFAPWLPGMRALYEAVPAMHVVRYPVKALLPFTLALAVLAARGGRSPRARRRSRGPRGCRPARARARRETAPLGLGPGVELGSPDRPRPGRAAAPGSGGARRRRPHHPRAPSPAWDRRPARRLHPARRDRALAPRRGAADD